MAVEKRTSSDHRSTNIKRAPGCAGGKSTPAHGSTSYVYLPCSIPLDVDSMLCEDAKESNIMATMASLDQRLTQQLGGDRERAFFTHSLRLLKIVSGHQVDINNWTITSYEVEFVRKIGYGGLYELFTIVATTIRSTNTSSVGRYTKAGGIGRTLQSKF